MKELQQKLYDKVRKHLLAQKVRCADWNRECLYRYKHLRCAVGVLISDEWYTEDLEYNSVDEIIDKVAQSNGFYDEIACPVFEREITVFLGDLQYIHDEVDPAEWREQLDLFAVERGLTP